MRENTPLRPFLLPSQLPPKRKREIFEIFLVFESTEEKRSETHRLR